MKLSASFALIAAGEKPALLIFVREDAASLGAERWDPLPELAYPDDYRYLVDPERAERRMAESLAFASVIDARGIQTLTVPAPVLPVDDSPRPDAQINEPYEAEDPNLPLLIGTDPNDAGPGTGRDEDLDESYGDAGPMDAADDALALTEEAEDAPRALLALPEMLLPDSDLAFRAQARTLRRRGEQVLFHGHWWSRLPEDGESLPVILDRAGDPDATGWPVLQGTVHLHRARFLHVDVDLWLNTMASYLPAGWQIDPAPLPEPSVRGKTLQNEPVDPWAPAEPEGGLAEPDDLPSAARDAAAPVIDEQPADSEEIEAEPSVVEGPDYPWRHAITHRQSRRMRSGETHYLDHPVLGVIVRLRPAGDELLPFAGDEELEFRERHGLPVDYLLLPQDGEN